MDISFIKGEFVLHPIISARVITEPVQTLKKEPLTTKEEELREAHEDQIKTQELYQKFQRLHEYKIRTPGIENEPAFRCILWACCEKSSFDTACFVNHPDFY